MARQLIAKFRWWTLWLFISKVQYFYFSMPLRTWAWNPLADDNIKSVLSAPYSRSRSIDASRSFTFAAWPLPTKKRAAYDKGTHMAPAALFLLSIVRHSFALNTSHVMRFSCDVLSFIIQNILYLKRKPQCCTAQSPKWFDLKSLAVCWVVLRSRRAQ